MITGRRSAGILVIQITDLSVSGAGPALPASSLSPPESAKEFPFPCLNGRGDRQHHSIPHETHSISEADWLTYTTSREKFWPNMLRIRAREALCRWSHAPLRHIWGIGECPAPVFMRPKHRRYSWPQTPQTSARIIPEWFGCKLFLVGGAKWRNSVELRNGGWGHKHKLPRAS